MHRLIQNKTDGKLVELPSRTGASDPTLSSEGGPNRSAILAQEKIEAISTEYSHLLVSQLDSQRAFYTEKLSELKEELIDVTERADTAEKELGRAMKKGEKATELARKLKTELDTEREVTKGMTVNMKRMADQQVGNTERIGDMENQVGSVAPILSQIDSGNRSPISTNKCATLCFPSRRAIKLNLRIWLPS